MVRRPYQKKIFQYTQPVAPEEPDVFLSAISEGTPSPDDERLKDPESMAEEDISSTVPVAPEEPDVPPPASSEELVSPEPATEEDFQSPEPAAPDSNISLPEPSEQMTSSESARVESSDFVELPRAEGTESTSDSEITEFIQPETR